MFEVNSSSVRSRGSLLSTLKEATLSHQVSMQPKAVQQPGSITSYLKQPLTRPPAGSQLARKRRMERKKPQGGGLLSFFKPQSDREGKPAVGKEEGGVPPTTILSTDERSTLVSLETSTVVLLEEVNILPSSSLILLSPPPLSGRYSLRQ